MDLSVTNTWLAIGAISLAIMAIAVIGAFVVLMRAVRAVTDSAARASAAIESVSQQVQPLAAQSSAFIGDMHDLVRELRHTDAMTNAAIERVSDRWRQVTTLAKSRLWPALAIARSASAVVQWLAGRKPSGRPSPSAEERAAEERFTYEGGSLPARTAGR
jgi:uncharacterized protein YoxC